MWESDGLGRRKDLVSLNFSFKEKEGKCMLFFWEKKKKTCHLGCTQPNRFP
jgi:hypothetical protein